jgi:hypothetical protein
MDPTNALNAPKAPAETSPATTVHHSLVAATGEQCPSCGNPVASDQRYCLHCGQRCGEPRLPFMNAVTFMDAMKRPSATPPSPPKKAKRRLSPNAALIAGVGTLLLAMGVGVLIGRSGNESSPSAATTPPVITVNGGGTAESANTASAGAGKSSGGSGKKGSKKAEKKAQAAASSGKGAEEVLKPAGDVKLPPATVQPGEKCESGAAGCKGGEFTGECFGE